LGNVLIASLFATQQPAALRILGPILVIAGTGLFVAAITDPGKYFSKIYEKNKNSWLGFWGISSNSADFRTYVGVCGGAFFVVGVIMSALVF
jgi:hypothetical protein